MGEGSGITVSCGLGHRCDLDLTLLWLWCRRRAKGLFHPLAGEFPHVEGAALKRQKKKKKKKKDKSLMGKNDCCVGFHFSSMKHGLARWLIRDSLKRNGWVTFGVSKGSNSAGETGRSRCGAASSLPLCQWPWSSSFALSWDKDWTWKGRVTGSYTAHNGWKTWGKGMNFLCISWKTVCKDCLCDNYFVWDIGYNHFFSL